MTRFTDEELRAKHPSYTDFDNALWHVKGLRIKDVISILKDSKGKLIDYRSLNEKSRIEECTKDNPMIGLENQYICYAILGSTKRTYSSASYEGCTNIVRTRITDFVASVLGIDAEVDTIADYYVRLVGHYCNPEYSLMELMQCRHSVLEYIIDVLEKYQLKSKYKTFSF